MGEALSAFLERHVETFNAAVRSADFAPLVALFAEDATLEFDGAPVGPFALATRLSRKGPQSAW